MQQYATVYKTYTGSVTNMLGQFCEILPDAPACEQAGFLRRCWQQFCTQIYGSGHPWAPVTEGPKKRKREHPIRTLRVDVYEDLELHWLLSSDSIAAMMHNQMYNKHASEKFLKQVTKDTAAEHWLMSDPTSVFRFRREEYWAYNAVCVSSLECKYCWFRDRIRKFRERELFVGRPKERQVGPEARPCRTEKICKQTDSCREGNEEMRITRYRTCKSC